MTRRLPLLLLVGLALAVYANTLGHDFAWDDLWWVVDNPALPNLRNMGEFFRAHEWYRPLALLSLRLDYAVAGLRPWFYHAHNVLLHAAVSLMVYGLLRPFGGAKAWLAAALFAVLPVHTEAVANVTSRSELLAALLGLLALSQRNRPLLAGAFLLLALLSKEGAVAVPALAPLLWWRRPDRPARREMAVLLGALVAAVAAYLLLRSLVHGNIFWTFRPYEVDNPLVLGDWPTRVRTALMIVGQNLALCFVPYHLSADYSFLQIPLVASWTEPRFLLWTALPAIALGGALAVRRTHPDFARGLAWFLLALFPVSNLVVLIGTIRGERLLYLPSVGTCLVLAEALTILLAARRRLAWTLVALLLATLGLVAARRNLVWRNHETVLAATVADSPRGLNAHYLLATHYLRAKNCAMAIPGFRRTLELHPRFDLARLNLAACLEQVGELSGAEQNWRELFKAHPGDRALATDLVRVCAKRNDWRCVAATLGQLLAANREAAGDAVAWVALGNALLRSEELEEAEAAYRRAVALGGTPVGHFNLAGLLVRRKRFREALEQYQAAERMGMNSEELYVDWATTQKQAGDADTARRTAARGLERFPDSAALRQLAFVGPGLTPGRGRR